MLRKLNAFFLITLSALLLAGINSAFAATPFELLNNYSISENTTFSSSSSAEKLQPSELADDFIVGYYIEPMTNGINTIDFDALKKIGITDIYVRATTNGSCGVVYTKLPQWKARADAANLRIHAWVWDGFYGSYAKAVSDMGINILIDMETYNMASKLSQLANIRKNTKGKVFTVCCKADGIDGPQEYAKVSKYCDYISPMLYKGDYNLSLASMRSYAQKYGKKYPIIMSLETYESDRNPVPKSNSTILAEIEAVRPYCKGVILFRYGNVSRFTGGVPNGTKLSASTGTKAVKTSSTSNVTTLKRVDQSDTSQNKTLVKALQIALQNRGYYTGFPVDGWFGPETENAVKAYQKNHGLEITGVADATLRKKMSSAQSTSSWTVGGTDNPISTALENFTVSVPNGTKTVVNSAGFVLRRTAAIVSNRDTVEKTKKLQQALRALGLYQNCSIDGWFGPYTEQAVMEFQRDNNITVTGIVDDKLLKTITSKAADKEAAQKKTSQVLAGSSFGQFMKATRNCQSTNARIVSLANSLKGNTSYKTMQNLFYYVRDKVSYKSYYNTSQGALGTLSSKHANCCDQAHLLIALLRAAGIPAKYGHATCKFRSGMTCGHVFAYAYVDGKWLLVDPVSSANQINSPTWSARSSVKHYTELPF